MNHLTQLPMINMTLNWQHINICNDISSFGGCPTWFLVALITITPPSMIFSMFWALE
jgi:hypothetical protein